MTELATAYENLCTDVRASSDPEIAPQMAAYTKDQFAYAGLKTPARRALQKPLLRAAKHAEPDEVLDIADLCWDEDEREFQYVGADLLRSQAKRFWLARAAILHQLLRKEAVNEDRLFLYVRKRAADKEFFIRKALGWALRDYARVAPDAVRAFVAKHEDELSGLTKREALKRL